MPHIEDILGAGHLPKLGQGLRPPPGIPHIHPAQRPPQINYGAVAQIGHQPRPQPLNMGPRAPGVLQAPGFGAPLPKIPKLPGLSKAEKHAMGIIKSPTGAQLGTPRKINQLLMNPTPKMQTHIDYLGLHKQAHGAASDAYYAETGQLDKPTKRYIHGLPTQKPAAMGLSGVPGLGQGLRYGQRFTTGEAETLTHAPAAMIDLGKHIGMGSLNVGHGVQRAIGLPVDTPDYPSQKTYFKEQGKALVKSYEDMFTTDMIVKDPAQFWNNAISIASVGAGTGLRVARIAEVSRALKAGTITREQAVARVGQIIKRPGPVERNILIGKADDHFNKSAIDNMGIHKREYQAHRPDQPGQPHYLSMPIWAHTGKPEESFIGPPGFDHADLGTFGREVPKGRPRDFPLGPKGMTQARAIIDPETGRVVTVNFTGKAGGVLEGKRGVALREKLTDMANAKLREAQVDPYIHPPAVKGALGGLIQKHLLDRLTERGMRGKDVGLGNVIPGVGREIPSVRNPILGASQTGKAGKYLRRDIEMQQNMARSVAEVQEAEKFGLRGPYDKEDPKVIPQGERLHPDTGIPMEHYKRPTPEEIHDNPYLNHYSFVHNTRTGKTVFSPVGSSHDEIIEGGFLDPQYEKDLNEAVRGKMPYHNMKTPFPDSAIDRANGWVAGTGIFDPDTGAPASANFGFNHPGTGKWSKKVLEDAQHQYTHQTETLPERTAKMTKEERKRLSDVVQARAYAIGPLKVHAKNWMKLFHGGMDAKDTILKDKDGYVGIKQPPESFKSFKKYAGEKAIARSWHDMVEHDPAKMLANPDAYSYYPKGFWQRLKPGKPGEGTEAGLFKTIDAVTQMVRSGRFLTPAYAAWFLQNGVLHLSQAGVYTLRNANDLRNEWTKMSPVEKANFDGSVGASHFGGGIARTGEGSEGTPFLHPRIKTFTHKAAKFWHAVDDRPWRRMSLIHELHREGFHTAESWGKLMREDPAKFRMIARRAQHEAIDYSEMGPAERATFQKLFTAWGWTRGASTYTMRFPFQHPAQFTALSQAGQQGTKQSEDWWLKRGGIAPQWLEGYMPLSGGASPLMGSTGILSPGETLANVLEALPGATTAQRSSLSEEESPALGALEEWRTGRDRFGRSLVGSQRFTQPLSDLAHRFRPIGMLGTLMGSHKGGGTFKQGPAAFAEGLTGLGLERLRDPQTSAALGTKDYEQALPKPDEIQFRYHWFNTNLPRQLELYKQKTGQAFPRSSISAIKGDAEAVERRDMFQYKYAADRGAHSFRSLPAVDRLQAGIKFMVDHKFWSQATGTQYQNQANQLKAQGATEKDMDEAANGIWGSLTIGQQVNQWNSIVKQLSPQPLQAARG